MYTKEKEIYRAYISKINSNIEKQIILLMIPNEKKEGLHYLAVKNLSTLLIGIRSNIIAIFIGCSFFIPLE